MAAHAGDFQPGFQLSNNDNIRLIQTAYRHYVNREAASQARCLLQLTIRSSAE